MMAMTEQTEQLRQELEEAFRSRAHLYRLFLEELEAEIGVDRAEAVMVRSLERRGQEVAHMLFRDIPPDPQAVGERFLSVSPDGGRMYPHAREAAEDRFTLRVHRCPLKDAWKEAGLPPQRVAALCRIAGAFDRGLFEAAGVAFSNETWSEARGGGCCWITLRARDPSS
jgi:L-2-amino-thiazoline-4-carboxylic acid hydrolase